MKDYLYFIAVVPEEENLRVALHQLKLEISTTYSTYHALKSPPHITLQRPFKRDESFEKEILTALKKFAASQTPFNVLLKGYGAFPPKVLYLKIDDHTPFESIHQELNLVLKHQLRFSDKELNTKIHPHLTLAHRDLDEKNFSRAWKKFKSFKFEAAFTAQNVYLLKHNGENWNIHKKFPLGIKE